MKRILALLLVSSVVLTLTACSTDRVESIDAGDTGSAFQSAIGLAQDSGATTNVDLAPEIAATVSVEYDSDDLDASGDDADVSHIKLEGNAITQDGSGATIDGNVITITSAGTYSISGALADGQIVVDTKDKATVALVLNGVDIACATSAPIYVVNAEKTVITLADGTENYVTDGDAYVLKDAESDEPNATIFSKDDLTINGNGSLTVQANYNNGIASKDDLKITGGNITVNAVNDGVKGRDSIAVKDGIITIAAGGDGMQANNDEDAEEGYIVIESGTLHITAGADAIQAETRLVISGGDIDILSGGGSSNGSRANVGGNQGVRNNPVDSNSVESAKGLKAGVDVTITGGTITIDSADDAIHSNDSLTIDGGDIVVATGDDGVHADNTIAINGGDLRITKSYEGIEGAAITINAGEIHLVASDDGINAVSAGAALTGRPGPGGFVSGNNYLHINGGYVVVDALGDGFDINGSIGMTGGVVIINGPTVQFNGPIDYDGAFEITGGFLVAAGSAGMAQAPSTTSTQYSVLVIFPATQSAGTIVHIEAKNGTEILTFAPTREYQSLVLSSPDLENGVTCIVDLGGSSTGTAVDGLYSGGTYDGGAQAMSFTVSSMVTGAGAVRGGFPGGNMAPPGGRRGP